MRSRKAHNNGIHRSARSEFLNVPSVPLARPVMPGVRPLRGGARNRGKNMNENKKDMYAGEFIAPETTKEETGERKDISAKDSATAKDDKAILHKQSDSSESLHVYDATEQVSFGDAPPSGLISHSFQGKSRPGETGTLDVCEILIRRLNQDGATWAKLTDISNRPDDIDCTASDGVNRLDIQVTRSESNREFWAEVNRLGRSNNVYSNRNEVADALRKVIEKKCEKISKVDQRRKLILALDATETISHTLQTVVTAFREKHGVWAQELEFISIWVVGPDSGYTHRLDIAPDGV